MAYQIKLKNKAAKELQKLNSKDYLRISGKIKSLARNPRPHGTKKLRGNEEKYRIRSGLFRVLYTIDNKKAVVEIYAVGHRKDIYR